MVAPSEAADSPNPRSNHSRTRVADALIPPQFLCGKTRRVPTAPWGPRRSGSACSGHSAAVLIMTKVKQRGARFGLDMLYIWNVWAGRGRLVLTDGGGGEGGFSAAAGRRGWGKSSASRENMLGHTRGSWVGRGKG